MKDIHPINITQLGSLGVDDSNNLYWNNRPVMTEQRVHLSWWVNLAVIVGGFSTAILAAIAVLSSFTQLISR